MLALRQVVAPRFLSEPSLPFLKNIKRVRFAEFNKFITIVVCIFVGRRALRAYVCSFKIEQLVCILVF